MDLSRLSRTGGPVLFWRGPDYDSLDLTGPVVANWVHKGVGLFGDYGLGEDFTLVVPTPRGLHWRELVAILAVLLGGGRVVLGSGDGDALGQTVASGRIHAFVPLGWEAEEAIASAEEVFVFNPPALALSTPVDSDFIDVNSAIRAYPDVASRRLGASGTLTVLDPAGPGGTTTVPWTDGLPGPDRPSGILVSSSTPQPGQWPDFLGHILGGGETVLGTGIPGDRITDLAQSLGEVRGRLGTWTK